MRYNLFPPTTLERLELLEKEVRGLKEAIAQQRQTISFTVANYERVITELKAVIREDGNGRQD